MRSINPQHRYDDIHEKRRAPETELERSLYVLLHGEAELNAATPQRKWSQHEIIDPSIRYPVEIFTSDQIRYIMEAFLIASTDEYAIGEALGMPSDEVSVYRDLFFDTSVFKTDLELIAYLQCIPEDAEYKKLYKIAFHQGLGALRWHFCRNKGSINPEEVIQTVMTDSLYRFLEHRGTPLSAKTAKEAFRLGRVSLDCARALRSEGELESGTIEQLRVKLEEGKQNRTIDEFQDATHGAEVLH